MMFVTSLSDESGRIGTVTRPKGTHENIATVQLGMLLESMATLSLALIPNLLNRCESSRHLCLKLSKVYSCPPSTNRESGRLA